MTHSKPRLISVGGSITSSPGLTLICFVSAGAAPAYGSKAAAQRPPAQMLSRDFTGFRRRRGDPTKGKRGECLADNGGEFRFLHRPQSLDQGIMFAAHGSSHWMS